MPIIRPVLEIVVAGDHLERLVLRADRVEHLGRVAQENAHVGAALDDERGDCEFRELLRALALRGLEAPHREPTLQRAGSAKPEAAVCDRRITAIAAGDSAV